MSESFFNCKWAVGLAVLVILATACSTGNPTSTRPTATLLSPTSLATSIPTQLSTESPVPSPQPASAAVLLREGFAPGECKLPAISIPTAVPTPRGLNAIDPTTGLHMTGEVNVIELASYRLSVTGLVDLPLELTYDEIRCLPKAKATCDLVCPGVFVDYASWAGAPLENVLALAGVQKEAQILRLESADGYYARVDLVTALQAQALLAYELEGETLPILHGFPIRAVIPGVDGNRWVKWLVKIEVE